MVFTALTSSRRARLAGASALVLAVLSGFSALSQAQPANLAAGRYHTCAISTGGALVCWGNNSPRGQLGDGTTINRVGPVQVSGLTSGVQSVTAGLAHTCAIRTGGIPVCFGDPSNGKLGNLAPNTTGGVSQTTPVNVGGYEAGGVAEISGGDSHTCLRTTDGQMRCWGSSGDGRLGNGVTSQGNFNFPQTPQRIGSDAASFDAGDLFNCAVTKTGALWCWGDNLYGQLGDGTNVDKNRPTDVLTLTSGVVSVSAGAQHACAVTTAGGVKCWGDNRAGQLGKGTVTAAVYDVANATPVDVTGLTSGVAMVSAGNAHTCAVTTAGGVKCWGYNLSGQLGTGANSALAALTPQDVQGLTSGVAAIAAGDNHTCARMVSGGVKCWGSNQFGQLGDGTTTNRAAPVDVNGVASSGPADYSDMWWAGQAENGWGMAITQHGAPNHQQFNAFYVYGANGRPHWYVMPGGTWDASFTRFSGAIFQTDGSPQDNFVSTNVRADQVGSATLNFTSASTATFTYTISGVTASKNIVRQSFGQVDSNPGLQVNDLWWGGQAQSGWGFSIAQQFRTLFGAWYTYDKSTCDANQQRCLPTWYVMPGGAWGTGAAANTYTGKIYSTLGSPWLGVTYNPAALAVTEVGTVSIAFTPDTPGATSGRASNATMSYTFTAGPYAVVSRSVPISRQPF